EAHDEREVPPLAFVHDRLLGQQDAEKDRRKQRREHSEQAGQTVTQVQRADRQHANDGDDHERCAAEIPVFQHEPQHEGASHSPAPSLLCWTLVTKISSSVMFSTDCTRMPAASYAFGSRASYALVVATASRPVCWMSMTPGNGGS